jgi:hypothetical protein
VLDAVTINGLESQPVSLASHARKAQDNPALIRRV